MVKQECQCLKWGVHFFLERHSLMTRDVGLSIPLFKMEETIFGCPCSALCNRTDVRQKFYVSGKTIKNHLDNIWQNGDIGPLDTKGGQNPPQLNETELVEVALYSLY